MKWFICDYVDCFHGYHCIDTGITLLLMSCQLKWQYNAIVIMMQQTGLSVKTKSLILDDIFHVDICELWVGGLSYSIIQMMMLVLFHFCNSCRFTNTLNTHEEIQQEARSTTMTMATKSALCGGGYILSYQLFWQSIRYPCVLSPATMLVGSFALSSKKAAF